MDVATSTVLINELNVSSNLFSEEMNQFLEMLCSTTFAIDEQSIKNVMR